MSVIRAAELLIEKIKKDYKDDIALVVMMGSHLYGETHSRSDLDMYFIPNTDQGFKLGFTFIIDGIGFDFWPISWKRIERIANHDENITAIITEGNVLYYSSDQDLERFNEVKQRALDTKDIKKFIDKASDKLNEVYKDYYKLMNAENMMECRSSALRIAYTLTTSIALLNRITIKRGRGKLKQEILNMPLVPNEFSELYDTLFYNNDMDSIKKAYGKLIKNTEILILQEIEKTSEVIPFKNHLTGFYEELINFYNKIYRANDVNDPVTALFASVEITNEINMVLNGTGVKTKDLPDLVSAYDPNNLEKLASEAKKHQAKFVELLTNNGVKITEFKNYDELESYLKTL